MKIWDQKTPQELNATYQNQTGPREPEAPTPKLSELVRARVRRMPPSKLRPTPYGRRVRQVVLVLGTGWASGSTAMVMLSAGAPLGVVMTLLSIWTIAFSIGFWYFRGIAVTRTTHNQPLAVDWATARLVNPRFVAAFLYRLDPEVDGSILRVERRHWVRALSDASVPLIALGFMALGGLRLLFEQLFGPLSVPGEPYGPAVLIGLLALSLVLDVLYSGYQPGQRVASRTGFMGKALARATQRDRQDARKRILWARAAATFFMLLLVTYGWPLLRGAAEAVWYLWILGPAVAVAWSVLNLRYWYSTVLVLTEGRLLNLVEPPMGFIGMTEIADSIPLDQISKVEVLSQGISDQALGFGVLKVVIKTPDEGESVDLILHVIRPVDWANHIDSSRRQELDDSD